MAGFRKADRCAEKTADLAVTIALQSKLKSLRDEARPLTKRSWNQYLRGPFVPAVLKIVSVAIHNAASFCDHKPGDDPQRVYQFAMIDLTKQLADICRPAGRPKLAVGIMGSSGNLPKRPANRPRNMSLEDERSWVNYLRGAALREWVVRNTTTGHISRTNIDEAIRLFNSNAGYTDNERRAVLAKFMSRVLDADTNRAPPSKNRDALRKRLRDGHRLYELPDKVRGVSR